MVEEIFEIWHSEMLQIGLILLLFDNYYFTMVEENFEIWLIWNATDWIFFLYLEKNLEMSQYSFA